MTHLPKVPGIPTDRDAPLTICGLSQHQLAVLRQSITHDPALADCPGCTI